MPKKRKTTSKQYVNHPRYGDRPILSGTQYSSEEVLHAHWQYKIESCFPETAIKADTSKQNYATYPIKLYVDIEKKCIQCDRWFIFFAQEQKYWFETLKFYVDADCVKCIDCRKKEQSIKRLMLDYETLVKNKNRTAKETSNLKNIALELFQLGYITNKHKIDSIS